jgi:hypothetical protein
MQTFHRLSISSRVAARETFQGAQGRAPVRWVELHPEWTHDYPIMAEEAKSLGLPVEYVPMPYRSQKD